MTLLSYDLDIPQASVSQPIKSKVHMQSGHARMFFLTIINMLPIIVRGKQINKQIKQSKQGRY